VSPAIWKNAARYHSAGSFIAGQVIQHNEIEVLIDDQLISDVFIPNVDEAKNHYDVRSEYTKQCGIALANALDRNVLRCFLRAADTSLSGAALFTGLSPAGTAITNAAMKTDAVVLAAGIFTAAQVLDENDVPSDQPRFAFVRPAQKYLLAANKDLLNKDWGGVGSYAKAEIPQVAGVEIVQTNQLPITDESADPNVLSKYRGNWSTVAASVVTPWASATVKIQDISTEMDYLVQNQGTLIVSKVLVGHRSLRPECATALKTS